MDQAIAPSARVNGSQTDDCSCPLSLRLVRPFLRATPPVVRFETSSGVKAPGDFRTASPLGCLESEEA